MSRTTLVLALLTVSFASNSSAEIKQEKMEIFPRGMQSYPPISLGELIYQSIPSNGRINWDALQIPSVRWLSIGVDATRSGDSFRYGLVRVRAGGQTTKLLRQRWEELAWSVTLLKGNDAARAEGVTSILLQPGIESPEVDLERQEICFGERFEGCEFPSSALRSPKHKLTLVCSLGSESWGEDVFRAVTVDGRVGTVVRTKNVGSGGTSNAVHILSEAATTYCRRSQATYRQ